MGQAVGADAVKARLPDWPKRLQGVLEAAARREFAYGNCVRLAAECVEAVTGEELLERCELLIAAAQEGDGLTLEELERHASELLGPPLPMEWARAGDVVLLDLAEVPTGGPTLGVCVGDLIACAGDRRIVYLRRSRGLKAWRVGSRSPRATSGASLVREIVGLSSAARAAD